MTDFVKDAFNFLGEPLATDELKAQLTQLRDVIVAKQMQQIAKAGQLNALNEELASVDAKAKFLVDITTQSLDMFVPPEPEGLEVDYDKLKEKIYDPLLTAQLYVTAGAVTLYGLSLVLPATLKVVAFASRSVKISKMAKSTKFATLGKLGSGAAKLAVALLVIDFAIKLVSAKKINDYMREKQQELTDQITEADQELARYDIAIKMREDFLKTMLEESGAETVTDYKVQLNKAIADVAEHATVAEIARNMLMMGMAADVVADLTPNLEKSVADRLAQRLNAEIMLMEGATPAEISQELGMTRFQIETVRRVLEVRGDAALGFEDEELARKHNVVDAIADLQIELAETALGKIWDSIEAKADVGTLARKCLIPQEALAQLMTEVDVRAALLAGDDTAAVAARYDMDVVRAQAIEDGLPFVQEQLKIGYHDAKALAVKLRLPVAAIPA